MVTIFSDVTPALDRLRGRYVLGIITNGNSDPERCGLPNRFASVVFSEDHGIEKPDPKLFDIALAELGSDATRLLHVGDSLEDDVEGARRVGARSCVAEPPAHACQQVNST